MSGSTTSAAIYRIAAGLAKRGIKVTGAALRRGLPHVSHFAAHYRQRFGEAPSQTIQRGRRLA